MLAAGDHKCINAESLVLDVIKCIIENNDESGEITSPDDKQFSDECVDSRTTIKVQSEDNCDEICPGYCFSLFPLSFTSFFVFASCSTKLFSYFGCIQTCLNSNGEGSIHLCIVIIL
jgi:hypothetical protein